MLDGLKNVKYHFPHIIWIERVFPSRHDGGAGLEGLRQATAALGDAPKGIGFTLCGIEYHFAQIGRRGIKPAAENSLAIHQVAVAEKATGEIDIPAFF